METELEQYKEKLRYLTKFAEESGAQFTSVIIKLQELINSLPNPQTNQELQILHEKFVDAVFLASEKIRFQEFIKDSTDWDRKEQIQNNQKTISLLKKWRSQELSEEEVKAREEHYKIFSQILENGKL